MPAITAKDRTPAPTKFAKQILGAIDSLPAHARTPLARKLKDSESSCLAVIGTYCLAPNLRAFAKELDAECLIGDLEATAEDLADGEPWATIRQALVAHAASWRQRTTATYGSPLRTRAEFSAGKAARAAARADRVREAFEQ